MLFTKSFEVQYNDDRSMKDISSMKPAETTKSVFASLQFFPSENCIIDYITHFKVLLD